MPLPGWLTAAFKRPPRRPLATRRPDRASLGQTRKTPLGMEATDLSLIDAASRRNDALERSHTFRHQGLDSFTARSSLDVEAMPEDETYAGRFHRAFMRKKGQSHE